MIYKKGISLIVLIITIIVMIILASAVLLEINDSSNNTKLVNFSSDITKLEDAVKSYYILNGVIPFVNGTNPLTIEDVKKILLSSNVTEFEKEVNLKADSASSFYEIDLNKIEINNPNKVSEQKSADDIYIVSYPSFNIYYLKGIKVKSMMYFSITSKIAKFTDKKGETLDSSNISIDNNTNSKINITKNNARWTNLMNINISSRLQPNDKLYLTISSYPEKYEFVTSGIEVNIFFNSLEDINKKALLTTSIPSSTITNFNNITTNKYIDIIKENAGKNVGSYRINLENYDNVISSNLGDDYSYIQYQNIKSLTFLANETIGSKIKNVRYEYLTKLDLNGIEVPYFSNIIDFNEEYMLTKAKKADLDKNNMVTIKLPKEVTKVKVAIIDNAGNVLLKNMILDNAHKMK
ncbi:MAG: hypothetical protein RSB67_02120 [Clostridia bacterium]